jgi:hypothetical protein
MRARSPSSRSMARASWVEPAGGRDVLLPPGDPPGPDQGLGPRRGPPLPRGHRQDLLQPAPALGQVPALLPEPPDRPCRLLRPVGLAGRDGPAQGGAEVGVLLVAAVQPLGLPGAGEVGLGGHGEGQVVLGVAPGERLQLAGGRQLLAPELADRLHHGEPRVAGGGPGPGDQRLVDQRGHRVERVEAERAGVADGLGRRQRPAAGEHRQPGEQPPLGGLQQLAAPGDGAAQGPLAVGEGPGPAGQQRQAALEPGTDPRHRLGVLFGRLEPRLHRLGPLGDQPDGLGAAERLQVRGLPRLGQVKRRHHRARWSPRGRRARPGRGWRRRRSPGRRGPPRRSGPPG